MYRVIAKDKGKYGNTMPGARYCFRKKSAAQLIALFIEDECEFTVEQFIRIHGDTFCWSNNNINEKFGDMVGKMLDELRQN